METKDYEALHEIIHGAQSEFRELVLEFRKIRQSFGANAGTATITNNAGGVGIGIAVTACVFTMLSIILFAIWAVPEIHDLSAYRALHSEKINKLETELKHEHSNHN